MARIEYVRHPLPDGRTVPVKMVYSSRLAQLIIPHMSAITLWRTIYFRAHIASQRLIRHELRHVEQWHELGPVKFLYHYLAESLKHGYRENAFEIDARHAEEHALQHPSAGSPRHPG